MEVNASRFRFASAHRKTSILLDHIEVLGILVTFHFFGAKIKISGFLSAPPLWSNAKVLQASSETSIETRAQGSGLQISILKSVRRISTGNPIQLVWVK